VADIEDTTNDTNECGGTDVPRGHAKTTVPLQDSADLDPVAQARRDGSLPGYRAKWAPAYDATPVEEDLDDDEPGPDEVTRELMLELSRVNAKSTFTSSIVGKLERALDLEAGELLSGALPIPRAAMDSLEADVTIFHPQQRRYVSVVVKTLESDELDEIARALSILRDWRKELPR